MDPMGYEKTTMAQSWDSCGYKEVTTGEIDKKKFLRGRWHEAYEFPTVGTDFFWRNTPRKTNLSHENQWFGRCLIPIEISPF